MSVRYFAGLDEKIAECTAHNLLTDLNMYGRIYTSFQPMTNAIDTLRPNGLGLLLYRLMYPAVKINAPLKIQSVTVIGNVYSANVTTDFGSHIGMKDTDTLRLTVNYDPEIITSNIIVTPGLADAASDKFIFTLEIIGCVPPGNLFID